MLDSRFLKTAGAGAALVLMAAPFWAFPAFVAQATAAISAPVSQSQAMRGALALIALSVPLLLTLSVVFRDRQRLGFALACCGLVFVAAPILAGHLRDFIPAWGGLGIWTGASLGACVLASRLPAGWVSQARGWLKLMAVALAVVELQLAYRSRPEPQRQDVKQAIGRIQALPAFSSGGDPKPDVYQILLDSFGRPDYLRSRWGVDVGPIEEALPRALDGGGLVIAAGSVFLAGAVRDILGAR